MYLLKLQMLIAMTVIGICASNVQAKTDWRYHSFGEPTIEQVKTKENFQPFFIEGCEAQANLQDVRLPEPWDILPPELPLPGSSPVGYGEIVDTIINVGKTVWEIVKANQPVVNLRSNFATALPRGTEDWMQLECWSRPTAKIYKIEYKNKLGGKPVSFEFKVTYNYGGRKDGVGRFLSNVTIVPTRVTVGWGYTFAAETVVANVLNAGSAAAPVAALVLQLNWKVETVLKHIHESEIFYVRGDGYFERVTGDALKQLNP